jgi:hypothetical protein
VNVEATAGAMTITSKENLDLTTTGTGNINLTTLGDLIVSTDLSVSITSQTTITLVSDADLSLNSANGNVVLSPAPAGVVVMSKDIDMNDNNITDANTITARAGLTLASTGATNINLSPDTGGLIVANKGLDMNNNNITNVGTINGYYPPLTIYKNATIGSAISRAPATAEIQVYQQTMTLKADTQYMLNMSYAGLTENVSTATPNNNWYIIYRVHQGTTPLTTANLWGLAQLFNNTAQAGGVSASFMTTTSGTYTGRFYIRNQNATVSLTVANIQASVIEVV